MTEPAVMRELAFCDPAAVMARAAALPHCLFLDSSGARSRLGRYAYVMADPYRVVKSKNGSVIVDGRQQEGNPFRLLKSMLATERLEKVAGLPPFQGGVAGLFGYDLAWDLERLPIHQTDELAFPDLAVGFFDTVLAFDLQEERCWVVSSGFPAEDGPARLARAEARADQFAALCDLHEVSLPEFAGVDLDWSYSDSRAEYEAKVQQVIDYIYAGDIFQANLSQRFSADLPNGFDPLSFYMQLRRVNPAPFSAYFSTGDMVIASSSPERFIVVEDGRVETRPIKGTRPRGDTPAEDRALASELAASAKDRAENVMIVDLLRNDLSRACAPGSVDVPEICSVESYASVHHLVSSVTGCLKPDLEAVDLMAASFPGGSITGAPKIRAMEIIAELEPQRRGPYCGSIGYLGYNGCMDSSILIRTLAFRPGRAVFQAGGGIVADSDPAAEYEETLVKARKLFQAFEPLRAARAS